MQEDQALMYVEEEEEGGAALPMKAPNKVPETYEVPQGFETPANFDLARQYGLIAEYVNFLVDLMPKGSHDLDARQGEAAGHVETIFGYLKSVKLAHKDMRRRNEKIFQVPSVLKSGLKDVIPRPAAPSV